MSSRRPRDRIRGPHVAALAGATAGAASADPPNAPSGHDCAGVVVSSLAAPGFGAVVSSLAQLGLVDNFGLRDCGQANGRNP